MSTIKEQATLKKIHVLTRADLDDLDLTQYTNQLFGTVDENDSGGTGTGEDGFSPLIDVAQTTNGDVVLTVTDKEGTETVTIPAGTKGDNGQDGGYYTPSVNDGWLEWSASKSGMPSVMSANIRGPQGERGIQGEQGPKGDTGTGFSISKTYSSVSAMNAGYATDGVPLYGFVLIDTGNVNDADNAKLYVKGDSSYEYLTDLSGSQGIKGETGAKGKDGTSVTHSWSGTTLSVTSASGTSSANLKGDTGATGVGIKSVVQTTTSSSDGGSNVITVTKTDNTTSTFTVKNGSKGSDGAKGADGVSPTITTSKSGKVTTITIKDANGTKTATINDGEDGVSGADDSVPSYWQEHINNKIITIQALQNALGKDCVSFVVATDMHSNSNLGQNTGKLAKKIMDECRISHMLVLGDMVSRGTMPTLQDLTDNYAISMNNLYPVKDKVLLTQGNHEGCYGDSNRKNARITYTYNQIQRYVAKYHKVKFDSVRLAYYVDDEVNKIRYLMLNSSGRGTATDSDLLNDDDTYKTYSYMSTFRYTQPQFDLVKEALETIPDDDWVVMACSHVPPVDTVDRYDDGSFVNDMTNLFTDMDEMRELINAYITRSQYSISHTGDVPWANSSIAGDFAQAKGSFIGYFAGHFHVDKYYGNSLYGFPITLIRCDGRNENFDKNNSSALDEAYYNERVKGTTTEQSFDVVTIDKKTKIVYLTKIGAGSDREYSYGVDIVKYSITNNFDSTKLSTSNSKTEVISGSSYSTTLTLASGYDFDTITITMGGVDITSNVYNNLVINIPKVTGNVVITATVKEVSSGVKNWADPSSDDWVVDSRMSSNGSITSGATGAIVTNYIRVTVGQFIYVKGLRLDYALTVGSKVCRSGIYDIDKTKLTVLDTNSADKDLLTVIGEVGPDMVTKIDTSTLDSRLAYIRVGGQKTVDLDEDIIITIDEEIV